MGITVHYAGRAASESSVVKVFNESIEIAREYGWQVFMASADSIREHGLEFLPDKDCEPLRIWFTKTRRFSDFCKTQFAGPIVHQQVRAFWKRLSPHFSQLVIYDEAEEIIVDGQTATLERAFQLAHELIEAGLDQHPGARMNVRLPSGRIADLVA